MIKALVASSKFYPEYSGSGYRAQNLYKRLNKKFGISYTVYSNSKVYKKDLKKKNFFRVGRGFLNIKNNPFVEFFNIVIEIFKTWIFIRNKIKDYSLLHTFGNSYGIGFLTIYFYFYKKSIIREICNIIKTPFYPKQFSFFIKRIFQKKNTLLIAISYKILLICKKFPYKNIWLRSNPVDTTKFYPNFKKKFFYRKKLTNFKKEEKVILYIASFMKQKHHSFLIDVIKILPKNFKLIIGGPHDSFNEKKEFDNIKKKIRISKLSNRVLCISGFIKNFEEYLWLSDVYVFPAHQDEAFGTPVVEAQACAIPVVSNNIKNLSRFLIKEGISGFCCRLDLKIFANKIKESLKIKKTVLLKNSRRVFNEISTEKIDLSYLKKIKSIIKN